MVKGDDAEGVTIDWDAESSTPEKLFEVEIGQARHISKSRLFPLTIRIPAGSRPVSLQGPDAQNLGRIVISTTHPTAKKIDIFVRFAITK